MVHPNAENHYKEVELMISQFNQSLNKQFEPLGIASYITADITEALFQNPSEGLRLLRKKMIELEQSKVILTKDKESVVAKWNNVFDFMNFKPGTIRPRHYNEMKQFFTYDVCRMDIKRKSKDAFMEMEARDVQAYHLELENILNERYEIEQKLATFVRQHSSDLNQAFSNSTEFVAQPNKAYISFIAPLISNGKPDLTKIVFSSLHEKRWE